MTLRTFIGSILQQVTKARAASDACSSQLAQQYLKHEYLRGFPVPRMNIKDMEMQLSFAVANRLPEQILSQPEASQNIIQKIHLFLLSLYDDSNFKSYFSKEPDLLAEWKTETDALSNKLKDVLTGQTNTETLIKVLAICVENSLNTIALKQPQQPFIQVIVYILQLRGSIEGPPPPLNDLLTHQVRVIIETITQPVSEQASLPASKGGSESNDLLDDDLLDMEILVGAAQLEALGSKHMQNLKINLTHSDRKWVAIDEGGTKKYILDRS